MDYWVAFHQWWVEWWVVVLIIWAVVDCYLLIGLALVGIGRRALRDDIRFRHLFSKVTAYVGWRFMLLWPYYLIGGSVRINPPPKEPYDPMKR